MTDARNFLLNSDYPLDKIVYMTSGSASTTFYSVDVTITHGLGFIPLPYIQWSFTSDFAVCYESLERTSDLYPPSFPYYTHIRANSTNIVFEFTKSDITGPQLTFYYRLICFSPHDVVADVSNIANLADNFILNTDYNYTKLYLNDTITTTTEPQSVAHNLGYIPQVMCWVETAGSVSPLPYSFIKANANNNLPANGYGSLNITTSNMVFNKLGKYHYRLYLDL